MCNQSAAFRFSCSCKHTSRLDEVIAFNALFPNTPLLGMDVFGEIGWDNVLIRNKRKYSYIFPIVLPLPNL